VTVLAVTGWIIGTVPAAAVFLWLCSKPERLAFELGRAVEKIRIAAGRRARPSRAAPARACPPRAGLTRGCHGPGASGPRRPIAGGRARA